MSESRSHPKRANTGPWRERGDHPQVALEAFNSQEFDAGVELWDAEGEWIPAMAGAVEDNVRSRARGPGGATSAVGVGDVAGERGATGSCGA